MKERLKHEKPNVRPKKQKKKKKQREKNVTSVNSVQGLKQAVASKIVRLPVNEADSEVSDEGTCAHCATDDAGRWISCDVCDLWFHVLCWTP